ncbi:MAG TPA: GNAT family N-acetyltransferase, partial [Anaerolineales bacterium]|nr:GNAT family N-acetyltransferase [Anaerolineales bacterium]
MASRFQATGSKAIRTMWISEHDSQLIAHLESRGFERDEYHMVYLQQSLAGTILQAQPPLGFRLCNVAGEHEAEQRAQVSYVTFQSSKPFDQYLARYRRFMHSPAYALDRDLVVEAPDGQFAAFCIFWLDAINRTGYFEPVGVHPDFRRKGLG